MKMKWNWELPLGWIKWTMERRPGGAALEQLLGNLWLSQTMASAYRIIG